MLKRHKHHFRFWSKFLLISIALLGVMFLNQRGYLKPHIAHAAATTFYIAANGSDSNNGTSESTPWLHAPGMPNCSGACATEQTALGSAGSSDPGVSFIFRGGDTWHEGNSNLSPYTGGTWNIIWSGDPSTCVYEGTTSGCFYVGVDDNWYNSAVCGSSWCRPILNADNPLSTTPVPKCTYQIGPNNQMMVLSNNENSYIYIDSFEFLGLCSQDTAGNGDNGQADVMILDDGTYHGVGGAGMIIKNNLYFHGWTVTTATESNTSLECTVMGGGGMESMVGIVIDGSDSDPGACNWGVFPSFYHMKDSMIRYTTQGVGQWCHDIHDNIFEYFYPAYVPTHNNILECNDDSPGNAPGEPQNTPNVFYNNIVRHSNVNVDLWFCPESVPEYWFDNIMYDTEGEGWSIAGPPGYGCTNTGGQFMFNNTLVDMAQPWTLGPNNTGGKYLTVMNEHLINAPYDNTSAGPGGTGGPNSPTNVSMSIAQAVTQGYLAASGGVYFADTCANDGSTPCAPSLASNATVGAGTNEQAYCAKLATYSSEYAIGTEAANACKYGTTDACTYNQATHTMVCPGSTPVARPTTGAWDSGAYQLASSGGGGGTPGTPTVPAGLTVTATTGSTVSLSWAASAEQGGTGSISGYDIYRNGTRVGTSAANSYTDTGLAASTTYSYTIAAYDTNGNTSTQSGSVNATTRSVDTTPPTVSLTAPANGVTVSSTVTLSANASDNVGVASVSFSVDGTIVGTDTTSPYTFAWNSASVSNGSHTITATAVDTSGNQATTPGITVTVSNPAKPLSYIQSNWCQDDGNAGTSITCSMTPQSVGDTIVAFCFADTTNGTYSFTDSEGNAYTVDETGTRAGISAAMAHAAISGTSPDTVTCAAPSGGHVNLMLAEYTGILAASPVDAKITANGTTANPSAGSLATTNANDLLVAALADNNNVTQTLAAGSNFTLRQGSGNGASIFVSGIEDQTVSAAGSYVGNFNYSDTTGNWTAMEVAYKAASSGSGGGDTIPPSVPTNLSASAISSSQVNLAWTASTDNVGVAGYKIYRGGVQVGTSPTNSYSDLGLSASTAYTYTVSAYDAAGNNSAQSASASATTLTGSSGSTFVYPLKASANNRYLVDQNGTPFLLVGDSPQSVIGNLSTSSAATFFADRKAHGFNALWINLLCDSYTFCNSNGTTYDNIAPFTSGNSSANYDLSTPNPTYFTRADAMINLAAQNGIVVFLDPIETGGWTNALENNGATKAFNYGVWVGTRYKNYPNIVWQSGNDFQDWNSSPTDNNLVKQVMAGIASVDPNHLQTIELDYDTSYSNEDDATLAPYLTLDAAYTYNETYDEVLQAYNSSPMMPTFMVEAHYDDEDVQGDLGTPLVLREQEYWTMTSGATGQLYGSNYTDKIAMGWSSANIDSTGVTQLGYMANLFSSYSWYNLVPDQSHAVVTAGYGTYNGGNNTFANATYASTAWISNGTLAITYTPVATTLTVNMAKMAGSVTARWYDPTNGTYAAIAGSPFANTGTHNFATPGNNGAGNADWVLVLTASGGGDTTPPTTSITSPANNATVSGTTTITASAADNVGVTKVEFYLDGTLQTTDTTSPYSWSWNTTSASNGTHSLMTKAYDAAGNVGSSGTITVTVSNVPTPVITSSLSASATVGSSFSYQISASNSPNSYSATGLPSGLSVNAATGIISGIPTSAGTTNITIGATNSAGTGTATLVITVTNAVDTTPPTQPTGLTVTGTTTSTVSLSWTASTDNVGVTGYKIFRGGTQVGTSAATSFTNTGLVSSTSYTYTVAAYDAAGNVSTQSTGVTATTKAQPDTTPPTVSLTAPANNATVAGSVTVTANASDNVGVASVQFKLDGANLGNPVTTAPYQVFWNSAGSTNGSHTLTAVASDAAGNTATAAIVTVTVNNVATPAITSALSVSATAGSSFSYQIIASNNPTSYSASGLPSGLSVNTATGVISGTPSTAGTSNVTIGATNSAGTGTATLVITVTNAVDTTPPTQPTNFTVTAKTTSTVSLSWTASTDNFAVAGYRIYRCTGSSCAPTVQVGTTANIIYTDTGLTPATVYTYAVAAYDAAGNVSTKSTSVNAATQSLPDTTPPTVSITSPANNVVVAGTISITTTASDNVGVTSVELYVDGTLKSTDTASPYNFSLDTTSLSNGVHTLQAKASDAAGNVGSSTIISVTVSNAPQTLTATLSAVPTSGTAPLSVSLTATTGGTAQGTTNFIFYCNRSDTGINITSPADLTIDAATSTSYAATNLCSYQTAGTYTTKVIAERGTAPVAQAQQVVTVSAPQSQPTSTLITSVTVSQITENSAQVAVVLNQTSSAIVAYGTTTSYGTVTQASPDLKTVFVNLTSLTQNTTYDFDVIATAVGSQTLVTSQNFTFTTQSAPSSGGGGGGSSGGGGGSSGGGGSGTPLLTVKAVVTTTTPTTAKITVTTSLPAITELFYGTSLSYGSTTLPSLPLTTAYFNLGGLISGKTYHLKAVSLALGQTMSSPDITFVPGMMVTSTSTPTSTEPSLPPFTRNLGVGSTGSDVTELQTLLVQWGYLKATPTGYFGFLTQAAVEAFQRANNISPVSGFVGSLTRAKLNSLIGGTAPTGTTSTPPPSGTGPITKYLGPGSSGPEVILLQQLLYKDGDYPQDIISGYYGSLTEQAVQAFQTKYDIVTYGTPDTTGFGAVGPKTMAALNGL